MKSLIVSSHLIILRDSIYHVPQYIETSNPILFENSVVFPNSENYNYFCRGLYGRRMSQPASGVAPAGSWGCTCTSKAGIAGLHRTPTLGVVQTHRMALVFSREAQGPGLHGAHWAPWGPMGPHGAPWPLGAPSAPRDPWALVWLK